MISSKQPLLVVARFAWELPWLQCGFAGRSDPISAQEQCVLKIVGLHWKFQDLIYFPLYFKLPLGPLNECSWLLKVYVINDQLRALVLLHDRDLYCWTMSQYAVLVGHLLDFEWHQDGWGRPDYRRLLDLGRLLGLVMVYSTVVVLFIPVSQGVNHLIWVLH